MRFDFHVHVGSGAMSTLSECVDRCSLIGLDGFAAVSKNGFVGEMFFVDRWELGKAKGIVVTNACQVMTDYGPLVVHGLLPAIDTTFNPSDPVDVVGLIDWAHDQGGAVVLPHLFRDERSFFNTARIMKGGWDWWIRKCDALEITWSGERRHDALIKNLASRLSKKVINGTDAHYHKQIGFAVVDEPKLKAEDDWREQHRALVDFLRRGA